MTIYDNACELAATLDAGLPLDAKWDYVGSGGSRTVYACDGFVYKYDWDNASNLIEFAAYVHYADIINSMDWNVRVVDFDIIETAYGFINVADRIYGTPVAIDGLDNSVRESLYDNFGIDDLYQSNVLIDNGIAWVVDLDCTEFFDRNH